MPQLSGQAACSAGRRRVGTGVRDPALPRRLRDSDRRSLPALDRVRVGEVQRLRHLPRRQFRLIPVALPGIRDEDMHRLGAGSLFSEINWADFRNGPVDPEAIRKLRAALLGCTPETSRAPSRLTPYL